jgi:hypothetical protein
MEAQIAGFLMSLPLSPEQKATAAHLVLQISASIDRHLTPKALVALAERGVTKDQAVEFLARRALEAVIEAGRQEPTA